MPKKVWLMKTAPSITGFMAIMSFILSFLSGNNIKASEYIWERSSYNYFSGQCYEVKKFSGKSVKMKASIDHCRPKKTLFVFLKDKGQCYEIDEESKGQKFTQMTSNNNCRPSDITYEYAQFLGRSGCYEIDKKTQGESYFKRVDKKFCAKVKAESFFSWDKKKNKGQCFIKNSEEKLIEVATEVCKPEETNHVFIKKDFLRGECFEMDIRGAEFYGNKVNLTNCLPTKTVYLWYSPPTKKSAQCIEVDSETRGEKFIRKVSEKKCSP